MRSNITRGVLGVRGTGSGMEFGRGRLARVAVRRGIFERVLPPLLLLRVLLRLLLPPPPCPHPP